MPRTVITNVPDDADEHSAHLGSSVVYKTFASATVADGQQVRLIYTNPVTAADMADSRVVLTAHQFQQRVPKVRDVRATVLEIGTGTGWTAGLLAHRLGSDAVASVDINPHCVADARARLTHLGLTPTLEVTDGYLGYPTRGPYDRIIATAALRKVPPAWLDQTRPGGTILTDLRGNFAGNLALFTVNDDKTAHGRFLPETVRFMPLRSTEQPFQLLPELSAKAVKAPGEHRTTTLDPTTLRDRDRAFAVLAQLAIPGTEAGHVIDNDTRKGPTMYFCLTDPHSQAWARVATDTTTDRPITQGGERRLWDELEAAHDLWEQLGKPRPENFTITITPDGDQTVNLPGADRSWSLPL